MGISLYYYRLLKKQWGVANTNVSFNIRFNYVFAVVATKAGYNNSAFALNTQNISNTGFSVYQMDSKGVCWLNYVAFGA